MKPVPADSDSELVARAGAIHSRVLTMDTHVDIPPDFGTERYDPREAKRGRGQIDLVGMERGGLDAVFFIVYVGQGERNAAGYARAMADAFAKFAAIRRMTDVQYPETIALARTAEDVRRIHGEGRLAALIGIENGHALGRDLLILDIYYDYGARYLGPPPQRPQRSRRLGGSISSAQGLTHRARRPHGFRARRGRAGQRPGHHGGHLPRGHDHRAGRHPGVPGRR